MGQIPNWSVRHSGRSHGPGCGAFRVLGTVDRAVVSAIDKPTLTRRDKWFLLYLAVGYLGFAEVLSWETSRWPGCIVVSGYQRPDNRSGQQTCATLHEGFMQFLAFIWDHATHDNIIAVASVMVAVFTATIWLVNRSQLQRSQEVERAYVSGGGARHLRRYVNPPNVVPVFPANASILTQPDGTVIVVEPTAFFELHINNHGKTPARIHHARVGFCDAAAPPPEPPYGPIFPEVDNIGPGTQSRFLRLIDIPQGQFGRAAICGRFYWKDIWDREWSSGFIYEIPGGPALPNDSLSIEAPPAYTAERME